MMEGGYTKYEKYHLWDFVKEQKEKGLVKHMGFSFHAGPQLLEQFVKLTAAMEREQEENQKQLKELTLSLRRSNEQESDVRTFIREIRQYATIQELDEGILNRLISRILVGEVKKVDGEKFQEIKIIYNFVGEIPAVTE